MNSHDKVMELARRRGFLWPSFEIYGGTSGFYDYGPLGAALKKKLEDRWREYYCIKEGFLEISSPTISPEEVFIASGHVQSFVDPMVECKNCGEVFKASELIKNVLNMETAGMENKRLSELIRSKDVKCTECNGETGEVFSYNLMFKTHIGAGNGKVGYLRPETAQGIFILFPLLYRFFRKKLPFGIAQLGRAYRNEISPRQGIIRLREFSQAEVEIFVHPEEKNHENFQRFADETLQILPQDGNERDMSLGVMVDKGIISSELLAYQLLLVYRFLTDVGISKEKIRFRQHLRSEMAHYAQDCWDAEVLTSRFGWIEVVGIADRGDYDLKSHKDHSMVDLSAYIQYEKPKKIERYVLKPNMSKIGSVFKSRANEIRDKIKDLSEKDVNFFIENDYIELEINREKLCLNRDMLTLKKDVKTVAGEKIIPHVIEPSYGIDRIVYCILESSYWEDGDRTVLSLPSSVAPIDVAVFPLLKKDELVEKAKDIFTMLKGENLMCLYDDSGSIGRRYARIDEIGVPFALTVDFDTLKGGTVTIRERDSTKQKRVDIKNLTRILRDLLDSKMSFEGMEKQKITQNL